MSVSSKCRRFYFNSCIQQHLFASGYKPFTTSICKHQTVQEAKDHNGYIEDHNGYKDYTFTQAPRNTTNKSLKTLLLLPR